MRRVHHTGLIPAALIAACCVLAAGCTGSGTSGADKGSPPESKSLKDKHAKLKVGMAEKDVTDIMGAPTNKAELDMAKAKEMFPKGVDVPDFPGLPGVSLPKMTVLTWEEGDMAFVAMLQDGKVTAVPPPGKKEAAKPAAKITKANVDKIKVGMKKSDVEDILGKGKVAEAGVKLEGFTGPDVMIWDGDEGTIMLGFIEDKVSFIGGLKKK